MLVGDFGRTAVVAAPGAWLTEAAGAATTVAVCGVTVAFADDAELLVTFGGVCSRVLVQAPVLVLACPLL